MLITFSFDVSSNLSQQKSPTAEIIGKYFLGTLVPRKFMPIISSVRLFCYNKFEETPNEKVVNMSKLTKAGVLIPWEFGSHKFNEPQLLLANFQTMSRFQILNFLSL